MKYVVCNYCGHDETEPVNCGPDLLLNRPGAFCLVRCCHCGLIYQNPQLTQQELAPYYPEAYDPYLKDISEEGSPLQRLDRHTWLARRCARVERHQRPAGRVLDVGCATGLFLDAMRARGWEVAGVEPSAYASAYARQTFDLDVATATLEEIAFPDSAFDVVTMWDVLEHVPDPRATLAEVARILRPGGLFVASLPNPTAVEARLFGSAWVGWDRPRHLYLFTPLVLRSFLHDAGFAFTSLESFSGRLGLTLLSLEFWLKARGIPERRWRPWLKALYSRPLRVLSWPVYWLGEAFNRTTVMTAFAHRRENASSEPSLEGSMEASFKEDEG